jgi:hypothetical protein
MPSPQRVLLILIPVILALGTVSCHKKDKIDTSPLLSLSFSTDTVLFDTVFTTVGSVTQRLMVYNNNDSKVRVASITLAGGDASNFRMNVNGTASNRVTDVDIPAHDSIFIFVRVTVDPSNHNTPVVITDSIEFSTNGNYQDVKLVAWGQDAIFLKSKVLRENTTWDSLKPFVVYGYLRVDTGKTLTIQAGTKVYFHSKAFMAVSRDGSLVITGNLDHPVRFTGDRLDPFYRDLPGQWDGIYLDQGTRDNQVNYAIIRNGNFGFSVDSVSSSVNPVLKIDNTIIQNMTSDGIYAHGTSIVSTNCVIGNCGGSSLAVDFGGSYDFRQLTIANYWSSSVRLAPALYFSNYYYNSSLAKVTNPLTRAYFGNTIVYGGEIEEITPDKDDAALFEYTFDHCLLKTAQNVNDPTHYTATFANQDPLFIDPANYDYRIDTLSPAIGKGIPMGVDFDIEGVFRGSAPDLGAYQFVSTR